MGDLITEYFAKKGKDFTMSAGLYSLTNSVQRIFAFIRRMFTKQKLNVLIFTSHLAPALHLLKSKG